MVCIIHTDTSRDIMTLRRYDLNLLTVLDALLRHRNVTRAGLELGLSQSAASGALMRLRQQFDDPLLVPAGRRLRLSRRAEALAGPLAAALEQIKRIIETSGFEPATSDRRMRIGTADYVGLLILPALMLDLQETAPKMSIQITWTGDGMPTKLRSGELDLALVPRGELDDDDLHSELLFQDDVVIAACSHHPDISAPLDLETYLRLPRAGFRSMSPTHQSFAEAQLAHNHLQTPTSVLVADFLLLPLILPGTRLICMIHRRPGERIAALAPIRLWNPPFPTDRLHIHAYWSHTADADPGHRWFRERLIGLSRKL